MIRRLFIFSLLLSVLCAEPAWGAPSSAETTYLKQVLPHIRKIWDDNVIQLAGMLLRATHSFNNKGLVVSVEINVAPTGKVSSTGLVASSGYDPFDDTALDAVSSLDRLPPPPKALLSDDGKVHMFWTLKRVKPYSGVQLSQIRYVRYSTSMAVTKSLEQGLYALAWARLVRDGAKSGLPTEALDAFIAGAFFKRLGGDQMDQSAIQSVETLSTLAPLGPRALSPFLPLFASQSQIRSVLTLADGKTLCALLKSKLPFAYAHRDFIAFLLLKRKRGSCFDRRTLTVLKSGSFQGISLLLAGARMTAPGQYGTLKGILVPELSGKNAHAAFRAIQLSAQAQFLPILKAQLLKATDPTRIKTILLAISTLGTKSAGLTLVNGLRSPKNGIVMASADRIPAFRGADRDRIWKFATWELGSLIRKGRTPAIRERAAHALVAITQGKLKNENNRHYFLTTFRSRDIATLRGAVAALVPVHPMARKRLLAFVSHGNAELRKMAVSTLARAGDTGLRPTLPKLLADRVPGVRLAALALVTDTAVLKKFTASTDTRTRFIAARRLATLDAPWVYSTIASLLKSTKRADLLRALSLCAGLYAHH